MGVMPPNTNPSLGEASAGGATEHPTDGPVPDAGGKPTTGGTPKQDAGNTDTKPASTLMAEILGDDAPPAEESTTTTTEDEQQTQDDQPPPQDDGHKPEETPPQDDGQKPEEGETEVQPEPEQEKSVSPYGRKRIKNLEKQVADAKASVQVLESRAIAAGYQQPQQLLDDVDQVGRALNQRDPAAIKALGERLVAAGYQPTTATPAGVGIDKAKALEAIKFGDLETLESLVRAIPDQNQTQPPSEKPKDEAAKPQPKDERAAKASAEYDQGVAVLKALGEEVIAAYGADEGQALLTMIAKRVEARDKEAIALTGHGIHPSAYASEFRKAREYAVAQVRADKQKRPPSRLPSNPTARNKPSGLMEEILNAGG